MNRFVYNGISSEAMGVRIQKRNIRSAPKYAVSMIEIPGRDGALPMSDGRFGNVTVSYTCFVPAKSISELSEKLTAIKGWLYTAPDRYHTLTDSYDTDFFRKALINNQLDITEQCRKIGLFTVNFTCLPFRYSNAGQTSRTWSNNSSLTNPFCFPAKPYLKIYGNGTGTLTIQSSTTNRTWQFSSIDEYIECDSELMNFYKGALTKNSTVSGSEFPILRPGSNTISFTGGITRVDIIPRWVSL